MPKRSKHKNVKTQVDGIWFASKKEAEYYLNLKQQERDGIISDLQTQVPFTLIPAQYKEVVTYTPKRHKQKIVKKLVERSIVYFADFVYTKDGKQVVEDTKGQKSGTAYEVFKLKRKMMLYFHGITVVEV